MGNNTNHAEEQEHREFVCVLCNGVGYRPCWCCGRGYFVTSRIDSLQVLHDKKMGLRDRP